jgi:hypothetical protein
MHPWERRLRDLSRQLQNCGETYFSPDLFRQNTNQFLQTSRTVTFIVQKNKREIPDYEHWYQDHVLSPWKQDEIMTWAKDARNVIEKEGDLDMRSSLRAAVMFSHDPSEDVEVRTTRPHLLQAHVDKIAKIAKEKLPSGVLDAAVLRIERRWVANSLPESELVYALTYVYARVFQVCMALAQHMGGKLDASVPHPTSLDPASNDVSKARYIKLGKPGIGRTATVRLTKDPNFKPPPALLALKAELQSSVKPTSLHATMELLSKLAQITFLHHGNHVPMLFLFDQEWKQVDFLTAQFADQADKFLFWRNAANRAAYLRATALVWISESWIRDMQSNADLPVRKMPIVGERLHVVGATANGETHVIEWNITRNADTKKPRLQPVSDEESNNDGANIFFIKPVIKAMQAARPKSAG